MAAHTTVAEFKGQEAATTITDRLRRDIPNAQIGVVFVLPNESNVVATKKEDTEGSIDLPRKRPVIVAIGLALALSLMGLLITRDVTGNWTAAIISAVLLAVIGGVVGALFGGAGRYAGARAWEQERQGDEVIGLVAVCLDEEAPANRAAAILEALGYSDVRIVSEAGAWHVPNT